MSVESGILRKKTVTIANGETLSSAADLGVHTLVGIAPGTLTGTELAVYGSFDGVAYKKLYSNKSGANTQVTVPVVDGLIGMDPADVLTARYIKVESNAAEGAAREIPLYYREV